MLLLLASMPLLAGPKPSVVRLVHKGDAYSLTVNGRPYFVKGAGGDASKPLLRSLGANSFRTWGADDLDRQLDEAQRLGLKVTVGIWLGHREHGFRYDDPKMVADQFAKARDVILRYRNHPAVLMWGIGNEMENYGDGGDPDVWRAVEAIAKEAKRLDRNHPTMTVVAEIGGKKVPSLHALCPSVDIVGINSYAGAASLPDRYRKAGGTKPYIVTEFGPPGQWESPKTPWGAEIEMTSTAKADVYRRSYRQGVLGAPGLCLGSYAFLWGNKQEATATWFGMLLPTGERLGAADAMAELWSGKPRPNRCPAIRQLRVDGPPTAAAGASIQVRLQVSDPENDRLTVLWVVQGEQLKRGSGGSQEDVPVTYSDAVTGDADGATVRLPSPGAYRVFVFVYDGHGGAAVGNLPLQCRAD